MSKHGLDREALGRFSASACQTRGRTARVCRRAIANGWNVSTGVSFAPSTCRRGAAYRRGDHSQSGAGSGAGAEERVAPARGAGHRGRKQGPQKRAAPRAVSSLGPTTRPLGPIADAIEEFRVQFVDLSYLDAVQSAHAALGTAQGDSRPSGSNWLRCSAVPLTVITRHWTPPTPSTACLGTGPLTATEGTVNTNISIPDNRLAAFCKANGITRFALFGSVLRDDFGPDSDVDVLVEFQPERIPGSWV